MLGKLIKHEWKSVYKINCIMIGAVVLMTLLGCIAIRFTSITEIFENEYIFEEEPMIAFIMMMSMVASFVLYVLTLMGAVYGVLIYTSVHFYKTMYTDEGYLIHTLPVTPHQILISKTLVSGIWYALVTLAVTVSIFSIVFSVGGVVIDAVPDVTWADFWSTLGEIWTEMQGAMGAQMIHAIIVIVLLVLVGPFCGIMMLFGAITLGQLSKKHKVMMSILAYIAVSMINGFFAFVTELFISMFSGFTMNEVSTGYMLMQYDFSLLQSVAMGVALYFISHYIITKKLNLE